MGGAQVSMILHVPISKFKLEHNLSIDIYGKGSFINYVTPLGGKGRGYPLRYARAKALG